MMSTCDPGRNASTPTLSMRPPLTTALTLPLMSPPSLKILTIFSQFCFCAAFSLERTTHALVVLEAREQDLDLVADLEFVALVELAQADHALALVAMLPSENERIVLPNNSCMVALMGFSGALLRAMTVCPVVTSRAGSRCAICFQDKKTALTQADGVEGYLRATRTKPGYQAQSNI